MEEQKQRIKGHKFTIICRIVMYTLIVLFSSCLIVGLSSLRITEKEAFTYQSDYKVNYRVNVNDSTFYDASSLEAGKEYISTIVNTIDFDTQYVLNITKVNSSTLFSNVKANLVVSYNNGAESNELWNLPVDLGPDESKLITDSQIFLLPRKFSIDYAGLRQKAIDFKNTYGLPVNANLIININTSVKSNMELAEKVNNSKSMQIIIPLLTPTFSVDTKIPASAEQVLMVQEEKDIDPYRYLDYIGSLGLGLTTIFFTLLSLKTRKINSSKRKYYRYIDSLFEKYDPIIVKIEDTRSLKELKEISVKEFDDLLDIEEEIRSPLLFFENKEKKECLFCIIKGTYKYTYIVKLSNFPKDLYEL